MKWGIYNFITLHMHILAITYQLILSAKLPTPYMTRLILLSCCLLFQTSSLQAQSEEENKAPKIKSIGIPFMENYSLSDYSSKTVTYGGQNYDVLIGDDKKIYFANIEGLLIYDGVNWTRFRLPGRAGSYSLTKAKDGTIYVGAMNEIGYLSSTLNGKLQYNSLIPELRKVTKDNFTGYSSFLLNEEVVF